MRTTKQKMARRHNREGGTTWIRKATDRQQWKTMEGLHPAVNGQSLDEEEDDE